MDAFAPTHVLYVDWTGALLARALHLMAPRATREITPAAAPPAMVYFNFRVFSANQIVAPSPESQASSQETAPHIENAATESDLRFYQRVEAAAVAMADASVALCPHDAAVLDGLRFASLTNSTDPRHRRGGDEKRADTSAPPCLVLNPPLREDLSTLARQNQEPTVLTDDSTPKIETKRQWLLCIARLSPEKTVEHFVRAVESAGGQNLAALKVTPRLVGSGPNSTYTAALRQRLLDACPDAVSFKSFIGFFILKFNL